jgi:carboxylesterase
MTGNGVYEPETFLASVNKELFTAGNSFGILLLHGFTSGPHEMQPLGEELINAGYTVSIPLLPGHGTTPQDLSKCRWYDWFGAAKEALFEIRKKCEKVIVVGQSMGGTLALHLAAHYQVNGISVLAPGIFFKEKKTRFLPWVAPVRRYRKKKNGPDIRDDAERIRLTPYSYHKTPIKAALELKHMFEHVQMDLPEVRCPVMIIHSTQDHVIDYRSSEYIYDRISSEHKKILTLNESYHVLTLDLEKHIVYREILKFVSQILDS